MLRAIKFLSNLKWEKIPAYLSHASYLRNSPRRCTHSMCKCRPTIESANVSPTMFCYSCALSRRDVNRSTVSLRRRHSNKRYWLKVLNDARAPKVWPLFICCLPIISSRFFSSDGCRSCRSWFWKTVKEKNCGSCN